MCIGFIQYFFKLGFRSIEGWFRSIGDWLKAYLGLVCNLLKLCLRMFTVSLRWDILFKDTMSDVHLKNTCMYVYINMIV